MMGHIFEKAHIDPRYVTLNLPQHKKSRQIYGMESYFQFSFKRKIKRKNTDTILKLKTK